MSSKGQGLSLSTIVIAAVVLLVLVILILLMTGYFPKWTDNFTKASSTSCSSQGGQAKAECASDETQIYSAQTDPGQICCGKQSCGQFKGLCRPSGCPNEETSSGCCSWENEQGNRGCGAGTCCKVK